MTRALRAPLQPTRPAALARLLAARELVVLDVVRSALDALLLALALEHPTLDEPAFDSAPPTLRRARHVARLTRHLRDSLRRYESAVDSSLVDDPTDDLPF